MGFQSFSKKTYRPKPPKKPVRLAFGLVEESTPTIVVPPPAPAPVEKQEIIGTLTLKKVKIDHVKPLTERHIQRVLSNLSKIYEEGKYSQSSSVMDFESDLILKLTFNYNQNYIDRIKGLDRNERLWNPEEKSWHIFIGCFDDVFDILGKGVKITEPAFSALENFIRSQYYAYVAPNKLGKLLLRESWYEEFDLNEEDNAILSIFPGSNLWNEKLANEDQIKELEAIRNQIHQYAFQRKPYSHQISGIEFLLQNKSCALLDEMGCGKSFQIASSIALLLENKSIEKCLIVCPKSLVHTWKYELSLATNKYFTIIEGTPNQRASLMKSPAPIFVVHYEGIRLEKEALAEWLKQGESMVVFDESQRIKNLNAQTTISAKYIRNHANRCVIATGTPIANRPLDLFAQYLVMDNGNTFGNNFMAFKNTFCLLEFLEITQGRKKVKIEKFLGIRNGDELKRRIHATSLRRLKSDVLDLPPIIIKNFVIKLSQEQKSLYAKIRDNVRSEIENLSEEEMSRQSNNILVKFLKLIQLTSNPQLLDVNYNGANSKFEELDHLLEDAFSDDTKKVILWSHFVENIEILTEKYQEKYGAVAHFGDMSTEEKNHSVSQFQDNPECRLFIATPQSAKEGLTLLPKDGKMKADTMVYLDLNFDAGGYIQSQARFHRIGQSADKCLVIHLIGQDTIDEYIQKTLADKVKTAAILLDETLPSDEIPLENAASLSKSDWMKILS